MKKNYLILLLSFLIPFNSWSQNDDSEEDFEDFDISAYEEAGGPIKIFCNNKVAGQSPTQLISIAYDIQTANELTAGPVAGTEEDTAPFQSITGLRLISNFPVLSRNNILINFGLNYMQSDFNYSNDELYNNPLLRNLREHTLRSISSNFTIFKPLNEKKFLLAQLGAELNGDYSFSNFQSLQHTRFPVAIMYGWKNNDRTMFGIGASRTYLGGSLNYLPVIYYFKTFTEKWGFEALAPARAFLRYRFNSLSLMTLGYQVEGATYRLNNFPEYVSNENIADNIELRRAELRFRLSYDRSIKDFIWFSVQAGYRVNWIFNVDQGEFFRGFDDTGFYMENELTNPLYFQFSVSLVSP
ncbi:MAG: DUF6268 family outer membrane beta-barrel protein [Cyclobacteriaceae bacterium]